MESACGINDAINEDDNVPAEGQISTIYTSDIGVRDPLELKRSQSSRDAYNELKDLRKELNTFKHKYLVLKKELANRESDYKVLEE